MNANEEIPHKEEGKMGRILIIALFLAFILLAGAVAAYYYTFHGYKKQNAPVAPTSSLILQRTIKAPITGAFIV